MKHIIKIDGITCPACKELILDVCSDYTQIKNSEFIDEKQLSLEYEDDFALSELIEEIQNSGNYTVKE